jgi:hypothetical protein
MDRVGLHLALFAFCGDASGSLVWGSCHDSSGFWGACVDPVFSDTLCVMHWCDGYGRDEDPAFPTFKDPNGKVISMKLYASYSGVTLSGAFPRENHSLGSSARGNIWEGTRLGACASLSERGDRR